MEGIKTTLLKKARTYGDSHLVVAYRPEPAAADSTSHGPDDSLSTPPEGQEPETQESLIGTGRKYRGLEERVSEVVGSIFDWVDWVEETITGDDD